MRSMGHLVVLLLVAFGTFGCGDGDRSTSGMEQAAGTAGSSAGLGSSGSGGSSSSGTAGEGGAGTGGTDAGGTGTITPAAEWASWSMPNPQSTGLPNPQSYTDNGDGTVLDDVTGLVWQESVDAMQYTSASAAQHCLDQGGSWRLPTLIELASLVDYTRFNPAIDDVTFPDTPVIVPAVAFLSSSPFLIEPSTSWIVDFSDGTAAGNVVTTAYSVRCVDGSGTREPSEHYSVESDGVRDNGTGLLWQEPMSESDYTFAAAAEYCPTLGTGWRVPSVKELQTLVDRGRRSPAIDARFFPNTRDVAFWTSSPLASFAAYAWRVDFWTGYALNDSVDSLLGVRCVR